MINAPNKIYFILSGNSKVLAYKLLHLQTQFVMCSTQGNKINGCTSDNDLFPLGTVYLFTDYVRSF